MKKSHTIYSGIVSALLLTVMLNVSTLFAQEQDVRRAGVGVSLYPSVVSHSVSDFQGLPGLPTCCSEYDSGDGNGFFIGALYVMPISADFAFRGRAGLSMISADFSQIDVIGNVVRGDDSNPQVLDAESESILTADLTMLNISPGVLWYPTDIPLSVSAGFSVGLPMSTSFEQREELVHPLDTYDENGEPVRNAFDGEIEDISSLMLGFGLGAQYTLPIGSELRLIPEVEYVVGVSDVVADASWKASEMRFGISVMYEFPTPTEEPAPKPVEPKPVDPPVVDTPPIMVTLDIQYADKETPPSGARIVVEEQEVFETFPVLWQVFFDENSADVSKSRLNLLTTNEANVFNESEIVPKTLRVYSNVLNILGHRLRENSSESITLTGCNMDLRDEQGNTELSKNRAESVKNYLVSVWGIDANRIRIQSRNLPALPSSNRRPDGQAENRRVEVTFSSENIGRPVVISEIQKVSEPQLLMAVPTVSAKQGVKSVQLTLTDDAGNELENITARNANQPIPVNVPEGRTLENTQNVTFSVRATDQINNTVSASREIPVEVLTIASKRTVTNNDRVIEKFSLVLFGFDDESLTEAHKSILDEVKERITSESVVTIEGYTDRQGNLDYNRRLSLRRCNSVREYLSSALPDNNVRVTGIGNETILFDNNVPEGRMYSRTVVITIDNPVKE